MLTLDKKDNLFCTVEVAWSDQARARTHNLSIEKLDAQPPHPWFPIAGAREVTEDILWPGFDTDTVQAVQTNHY